MPGVKATTQPTAATEQGGLTAEILMNEISQGRLSSKTDSSGSRVGNTGSETGMNGSMAVSKAENAQAAMSGVATKSKAARCELREPVGEQKSSRGEETDQRMSIEEGAFTVIDSVGDE